MPLPGPGNYVTFNEIEYIELLLIKKGAWKIPKNNLMILGSKTLFLFFLRYVVVGLDILNPKWAQPPLNS